MGESPEALQQRIAELEATLNMPVPESVRQMVERELADLRAQQARVEGHAAVSDTAQVHGPVTGVNTGTIICKYIFGRDPEEAERRQLVAYLQALSCKLASLPLRGIDEKLHDRGEGVAMPAVYTMLATGARVEVARGAEKNLSGYFEEKKSDQLKREHDPDYALPTDALWVHQVQEREERQPLLRLMRARLATEVVHQHRRLVLLGPPGGGKSTFVRYLSWTLAQRGLDVLNDATSLFGWADEQRILPVLLPLRTLAGRLAGVPEPRWENTISAALQAAMAQYDYDETDAIGLLRESLRRGAALLLFDGLDEVPIEATDSTANRLTTLQAVRAFIRLYPDAQAVVTCRTRAFSDDLRECLSWPTEELAPFTMGQVRHFVPAWYRELAAKTDLTEPQAEQIGVSLMAALDANDQRSEKLREMAGTPLLLTMMAMVLYNKGELPRDRPHLYEAILDLLLGQWDKVKYQEEQHRLMDLGEAIGRPDWTTRHIRPLLDQLSYEAHATATSEDGRGRLERGRLFTSLYDFLSNAGMTGEDAGRGTHCFLDYINQRSGLLLPDGPDSYAFAHLTLQEHCAGRHMLRQRNAVEQVLQYRQDDRWREPIFLGLGTIQEGNPWLIESVLRRLIQRDSREAPERWYRDLILAAEIGQDREWSRLHAQGLDVEYIQRDLRDGLTELLDDPTQPLPVAERVRAGFLLGDLGDPRIPVTDDEWQRACAVLSGARPSTSDPLSRYWCYVPAGTYIIGSRDDDPDARNEEKPQHTVTFEHPFWVARFLLTNAQWQAWVRAGGSQSSRAHDPDVNHPNQPVVGVSWHMVNDYGSWLSERLGLAVRLPTEAEWEAAARGSDARLYPWGDTWQADHAATEEDRETRGWRWSVPVGCYAAGAAPCGALDMAGNAREWVADVWQSHPGAAKPFRDDDRRVLKGGGYVGNRTYVRGAARDWNHPDHDFHLDYSVRLFVSPQPS